MLSRMHSRVRMMRHPSINVRMCHRVCIHVRGLRKHSALGALGGECYTQSGLVCCCKSSSSSSASCVGTGGDLGTGDGPFDRDGVNHGFVSDNLPPSLLNDTKISVVHERVTHDRYITLYDRKVHFESKHMGSTSLDYDVVGHPKSNFRFACVMPVRVDKEHGTVTTTVVWEYAQGLNTMCATFPTGGFDASKHDSIVDTARAELAEEARLSGGELTCLVDADNHPGLVETKWCRNRFYPFLCVGAETIRDNPPPRDLEEDLSMRVCEVSLVDLKRLLKSGDMLPPSVHTAYLGLEELARRGVHV
ncbi:hypothetical protein PPROV_000560600 [Pycnococcus provasolii]|uniref:Nudix hydrolase domain-containing protein n=1 Tax=Pycnococcus provasolii TaxID=41880 RepID=A0A830HJ36_9CHLO|nr:hypothetical protein PPROV_000560600 [Pycnococcus provasolii]